MIEQLRQPSAWIELVILTLVFYGILNLTAPTFYGDVAGDPLFIPLISLAAGLLIMGHIVIWKMVNFRF